MPSFSCSHLPQLKTGGLVIDVTPELIMYLVKFGDLLALGQGIVTLVQLLIA